MKEIVFQPEKTITEYGGISNEFFVKLDSKPSGLGRKANTVCRVFNK